MAQRPADSVIVDGRITTMRTDEINDAEALAISRGRLAAVGTTAEISGLIDEETRVIDVDGRTAPAEIHRRSSTHEVDVVGSPWRIARQFFHERNQSLSRHFFAHVGPQATRAPAQASANDETWRSNAR